MSVYVDNAKNGFGRMRMCHMMADTLDELHAMAERLELKRSWFQPKSSPHYDICQSKRARAVQLGAIEVDRRQLVEVIKRLRGRV